MPLTNRTLDYAQTLHSVACINQLSIHELIGIGSCRDTSSCLTPEWNVHVANVSVAIILISAAASIGIFKQSYEIIFWTVLLAWGSLNGGGSDFISRNVRVCQI